METGKLDMPRGKTGAERKSYLWKRTREALQRVSTLKHTARALDRDGENALVFWTRKGLPMYREVEVAPGQVKIDNSISGTFSKLARSLGMNGVTQYRLRHTFKTLGKKAKDRDALNLMMGHVEGTTGETYDHETISLRRVKRVALKVKGKLWPKPKADTQTPRLRLAGVA